MNDTGGHAFPNITPDMQVDGGPGMTLRDYFAGQALISLIQKQNNDLPDYLAPLAYHYADAMLKERAKHL